MYFILAGIISISSISIFSYPLVSSFIFSGIVFIPPILSSSMGGSPNLTSPKYTIFAL